MAFSRDFLFLRQKIRCDHSTQFFFLKKLRLKTNLNEFNKCLFIFLITFLTFRRRIMTPQQVCFQNSDTQISKRLKAITIKNIVV